MLNYYFRTVKDANLKVLAEPRPGVWIHVVAPTESELDELADKFNLERDILVDATDFYEVPRMEKESGSTYFFTRYPYKDPKEGSSTAPLLIVVGESFVLSIALDTVGPFQSFIDEKIPIYTTQKAKLFIAFMEALTKAFDKELVRLRKAVHKDRVRLRSIGTREIERLVAYENTLNSMVDALIPTNAWLQQLTKGGQLQLFNEDVEVMEDLVIANGQVVNSARSILKNIQNIRSASEAIMSSRLNHALRILTVLTILLTVPLVIASLYGMNVPLPGQDSVFAFGGIILLNLIILMLLAFVFRKNNWF
jgi:magnesium transporter